MAASTAMGAAWPGRHDRRRRPAKRSREVRVAADEREPAGTQQHVDVDLATGFQPPQRQAGDVLAPSRTVPIELVGELPLDRRVRSTGIWLESLRRRRGV